MKILCPQFVSAVALFCGAMPSFGAVVYNEAVNGDLSNDGLAPTVVAFAAGSNQVLGSTGRGTAIDRDYLTFTIPVGLYMSSLTVLPTTTVGGATSFIGLEAGPQVTLATSATVANGLLGWWHYAPADGNILSNMAIPSNGSSGFSLIGPGTYSVWIQDFNAGTFTYSFDFALAPTPEPSSLCSVGILFLGGFLLLRRSRGPV